jgi:protoporphyrinogen/coproporphyrinogen III oxidase
MPSVVIVGAGISGLALAYRLGQQAPVISIQVLEASQRIGGKVWSEHRQGFLVESGANGFLDLKPSSLELCHDLGIADQLISGSESARTNRYLYRGRGLEKLPSSLASFLRSPVLSWKGKLSLLSERLRPRRRELTDESVADFARRRLGREAADNLVDAFVSGIHAADPTLLSLAASFPRLAALEREYGSVLRGMAALSRQKRKAARAQGQPSPPPQRLWSFAGGLRVWIEALASRLASSPEVNVEVQAISPPTPGQPGWAVLAKNGKKWVADAVVLTCPTTDQARLIRPFDNDLAGKIDAIAYAPVIVVALGFRAVDVPLPLDGFGYLTPQRLKRDVLGVQWCSSIFPGRAGEGQVLLRAMCGGWGRQDIVGWDDERLSLAVRAELRASLGITAAPILQEIIRWPRALPQYHLGHGERVNWIEARSREHPGLFLGGNAYGGVSLNDCTERAKILASQILPFLRTQARS